MGKTFRGGIHPNDYKSLTKDMAIEELHPPKTVVIPLSQHIGAPCEPMCQVGDEVKMGQMIGKSASPVSAPVHSSVSGKIVAIGPCPHPSGTKVNSITIENDFADTLHESVTPKGDYTQMDNETLINIISDAGIVGMGGATFPMATKIRSCYTKPIDYVIINASECEPYLTSDYRSMLERPEAVIYGLKVLMKIFGVRVGYIGIEDNKPDAIEAMQKLAAENGGIKVEVLKTKYPQGGEKQLIYAISGREVPSGKLPVEVGAAVFNLGSCIAVHDALIYGMPSIERIVTVTGKGITSPRNLKVRVGTSFEHVIAEGCGGLKEDASKVIMGGPMMGITQFTTDVPVIKGTSGILVLTKDEDKTVKAPVCIRCGKCIEVCPMGLVPCYMNLYSAGDRLDLAEKVNVLDCIECGACTYVCPGRLHLVQTFRVAKLRITEQRRAAQAKAGAAK